MIGCWRFTSWQHLRSYEDRYQLGDQATWYPTQSHYDDTEPTSPSPILIMKNACLKSDTCPFFKSLVWLDRSSNPCVRIPPSPKTGDGCSTHSAIPSAVWYVMYDVVVNSRYLRSKFVFGNTLVSTCRNSILYACMQPTCKDVCIRYMLSAVANVNSHKMRYFQTTTFRCYGWFAYVVR